MFRFEDRGYDRTLVVARGWAFDNRIFASMDLSYNYAFHEGGGIDRFVDDLQAWLANQSTKQMTLMGWSMGAYAVSEFALAFPEAVEALWLVGARLHYPEAEVEHVRTHLQRNKLGFLRKFYKDCFTGHAFDLYRHFKKTLQTDYLEQWTIPGLLEDLAWIEAEQLDMKALDAKFDVLLVHGLADRFVGESEARALAANIKRGRTIFWEDCGHAPFLESSFGERVHD